MGFWKVADPILDRWEESYNRRKSKKPKNQTTNNNKKSSTTKKKKIKQLGHKVKKPFGYSFLQDKW